MFKLHIARAYPLDIQMMRKLSNDNIFMNNIKPFVKLRHFVGNITVLEVYSE